MARATVFLYGLGIHGEAASNFVGDAQGVSNIAARPKFSQSGREGPSIFPNTAVGGRVAIKPAQSIVFRTAVLDGVPVDRPNGVQKAFAKNDGLLIIVEGAYLFRPSTACA